MDRISPPAGGPRLVALALLVAALAVAACTGGPPPAGLAVEGVSWRAVSVAGGSVVAGQAPSLTVNGGRITGTTGCNSFGGPAEFVDGRLILVDVAMTAAACIDPAPAAVEAAFTAILFGRPALGSRDGRLVARGEAGEVIFEAADAAP